jgi:hypothetical protein
MYAAAPSLTDQSLSGHSNYKLEMLPNFGPATGEPNPASGMPLKTQKNVGPTFFIAFIPTLQVLFPGTNVLT